MRELISLRFVVVVMFVYAVIAVSVAVKRKFCYKRSCFLVYI